MDISKNIHQRKKKNNFSNNLFPGSLEEFILKERFHLIFNAIL